MSTIESNTKNPLILSISVPPPPPSPVLLSTTSPLTPTTSLPSSPASFYDDRSTEKLYKKEKQILFEYDQIVKDIRFQLNEQLKCLEQRIDTQLSILAEIQEYFRRRADVEIDYAKNLDNLHKQIGQKHRAQKARRETWSLQSIFQLWDTIVQDTRHHTKYHTITSDVCGKYMYDKFNEIEEDTRRMFMKCKSVGLASHEDIYKVLNELKSTMKTYHQYQSESKQAEQKLRAIQQQMAKIKNVKKQKAMGKRVEKRQMKYTETKVKAFKARNDYLMAIESVNAALQKYCSDDVPDLIDCMNFGFHTSIAKCIQMYLSAQDNIRRGRQITIDTLNRAIADLDTVVDKQKYIEYYSSIFTMPKKIKFEPHKGDEVSTVNAQVLIRDEMQSRFIQMQSRLAVLKTENDEIFKTIEATEQSLMEYINTKNSDVSDLFKDLNLPQNTSKDKRKEIEDYYVEKFKEYTLSSNLISRLQARHDIMQKALGAASATAIAEDKNLLRRPKKPKQIGRAPILGRPRLFGGKLLDYIQVTEQQIPLIISSCVSAINRLGLHNQGIFRVPGAQVDINQFKEAFEKGDDPLVHITGRDMNSVAGVLKLYFRELKEPLIPRDMFDLFISCIADVESQDKCVDKLCQVVKLLPHPIFVVMRYCFAFLNHLAEYSDENMMDASNLASCLAPSLMPIPEDKDQVHLLTHTIELTRIMITNHEDVFPVNDDSPVYEKFAIMLPIDGEEDEDDEGISERSLRRSPSDDEMEMVEAVALFDYHGRTDRELSFRKSQLIYIHKKMNHEWWLGRLAGGNQSGFVPDGYIKLRSRRRDSAPVPPRSHLSITPNPSSLVNLPILSNARLDASQSTTSSDVDHNYTDVSFHINNEQQDDALSLTPTHSIDNVLLLSSSIPTLKDNQQALDVDLALREILSGIQTVEECHAQYFRVPSNTEHDIDAPDLVLNLPKSNRTSTLSATKSLDESSSSRSSLPVSHSTIIIDLSPSSRSNSSSPESIRQKIIPLPIIKNSEKTLQLIKRLDLQQSKQINAAHHDHPQQQHLSLSASSKATPV